MFDTRNHSSCGFGEGIISYLYREMGAEERKAFEEHLETCVQCPDELAAYASVSAAIGDWKSEKFEPMSTPQTILPNDDVQQQQEHLNGASISIVEKLQLLFLNLPGIWKTASAFAVIAVAAGFAWIVFGGLLKTSEIAVVPPVKENTTMPAVEIPSVARSEPAVETVNPGDENRNVQVSESNPQNPVEETVNRARKQTTTRGAKRRAPKQARIKSGSKDQAPVKKEPVTLPVVPRLTELAEIDDIDDSGLRLSDLFAGTEDR